jgi:MFS family permease
VKYLSRTVWILSGISLLTDIASEMLYPVMPVYLKSIGFSVVFIGILEGVAEATAAFSKGYFGQLSDATGKRSLFVQAGYALSAFSKPFIPLWPVTAWVFLLRTLDRLGKGIRTGARDALLSGEATPATKGRVFGFHRSMDSLGAVIGPAAALAYLYVHPGNFPPLFYAALIPGVGAILLSLRLRDQNKVAPEIHNVGKRITFFSFLQYWRTSPAEYRRLAGALLAFALFNSSDVFLLLKARESGLSDVMVIGMYVGYNLIYALASFPAGGLGDRFGLKPVLISGLIVFALVYAGFGYVSHPAGFLGLFLLYGLYAACTDGISKAWISNICPKNETATAIGTFTSFQSICTMFASIMAGLVWEYFGAAATFWVTSAITAGVAVYMLRLRETRVI